MAKDDFDLDFDDGFDDFNFGDDAFNIEQPKDDRTPVTKLTTSFLEGVKDELIDPKNVKKRVVEALPDGYGDAVGAAEEVLSVGSNLYNMANTQLEPVVRDAKRITRKILPKVSKVLPKSISDKLEEITQPEDRSAGPSLEQVRESQIEQTLGDLFKVQLEKDQADREEDTIQNRIKDRVDEERFKSELQALNNISSSLNRVVGYQDQVLAQYQKKSLELQYRQYFVTHDLFEVTKESSKDTKAALLSIIKNTALPETEKVKMSEQDTHLVREKLAGAFNSKLGEWTGASEYIRKVGDKITNKVKENLSSFKDSFSAAASRATAIVSASAKNAASSSPISRAAISSSRSCIHSRYFATTGFSSA